MPRAGICLETVDVRTEPPTEVEAVWISAERARYLLDLLAIDTSSPEYLAVDPEGAPDFTWWWSMYVRCASAASGKPELGVWPHPPRDYCHDPATILAALNWLRRAIGTDELLKREAFWRWYGAGAAYEPSEFGRPFEGELDAWRSACERAQAGGMKVALRVDE